MQCEITDPEKSDKLEAYVERLVEARRKKNVTPDMARDLLHDPNYFGTVTNHIQTALYLIVQFVSSLMSIVVGR